MSDLNPSASTINPRLVRLAEHQPEHRTCELLNEPGTDRPQLIVTGHHHAAIITSTNPSHRVYRVELVGEDAHLRAPMLYLRFEPKSPTALDFSLQAMIDLVDKAEL